MDSRLIFESAKTYIQNVTWIKPKDNVESEWSHIGTANIAQFEKLIKDYFITDELYVAFNRNESFQSEKEMIAKKVVSLFGSQDFSIWNWSFNKVIEFNKIGVYRKGIRPATNSLQAQ